MRLRNASDELLAFVGRNSTLSPYLARLPRDARRTLQGNIGRFLRATMDEVRVDAARFCTLEILRIADLQDLEMMREGVWKREATGAISYPGQRDHTAHTLNNWLLGWYIYDNSRTLNRSIGASIRRRGWNPTKPDGFTYDEYFGHAWQFVSLLHDIGYLFEGALETMDPAVQSSTAQVGVRIVNEYFQYLLWEQTGLASAHEQRVLLDKIELRPAEAPKDASLFGISFFLRDLGDLGELTGWVSEDLATLPGDAFDLWRTHFEAFGEESAARRMDSLEKAFHQCLRTGLGKTGIRILDHAVCSGLLLLKISTYYYTLLAKLRGSAKIRDDDFAAGVVAKVKERALPYRYDPEFWWSGIVWATASTALHNIQQQGGDWHDGVAPGPLPLSENPLAYLGILVDCLQEWDRYFVFTGPGRLPIQGIDVGLGVRQGKVVIRFADESKIDKASRELDKALQGWRDIVDLSVAR